MGDYSAVPTIDLVEEEQNEEDAKPSSLQSNIIAPISRPPTRWRDWEYLILFILQFFVLSSLALLEKSSRWDSFIKPSVKGIWDSMIMTSIMLGSFFGALSLFLLLNPESREFFMSFSIPLSIVIKVCLANILMFQRTQLSWVGLYFLLMSLVDCFSYRKSKDNLNFTCALLGLAATICEKYGLTLVGICFLLVSVQTCFLLWWSVFLVRLLAFVPVEYFDFVVLVMVLSLYWTINFFHAMMSYIVGGSVLWYFLKPQSESLEVQSRLFLFLRCSISSSVGSLCKGSLLCPLCEVILWLRLCCLGGKFYGLVRQLDFIIQYANYNRLCYSRLAVYGQTLRKATDDQIRLCPSTAESVLDDSTGFLLGSVSNLIAGIISAIIGVFAGRNETVTSLPLLMIFVYVLSFGGVSLVLRVYLAAVDAFHVSFTIQPDRLAEENQIIFLRFLRSSETGLR